MVCRHGGRLVGGRIAIVGLVGGIGSGKSTAASMFADMGVPALDLDEVGRKLTLPGAPGVRAIVETFGDTFMDKGGRLDRARLARLGFEDEQVMRKLTDALHPLIWAEAEGWLAGQDAPYALIEAVVLLESGAADRMDMIVAVQSDVALRRQRVLDRGHPDPSMFDAIVRRQCSDTERMQQADFVIHNDGDLAHLRQSVIVLHRRILCRCANTSSVDIATMGE
jgi:dephospho-CoA kinase